jgi:hypothetical protein
VCALIVASWRAAVRCGYSWFQVRIQSASPVLQHAHVGEANAIRVRRHGNRRRPKLAPRVLVMCSDFATVDDGYRRPDSGGQRLPYCALSADSSCFFELSKNILAWVYCTEHRYKTQWSVLAFRASSNLKLRAAFVPYSRHCRAKPSVAPGDVG